MVMVLSPQTQPSRMTDHSAVLNVVDGWQSLLSERWDSGRRSLIAAHPPADFASRAPSVARALGELRCITNLAVQFAVRRVRTLSHRPPPVIGAAPLPALPAIGVGFRQGPAGGSAGCGNEEKGTGDVRGGLESARPSWIHFHDCCRSADQSVKRSNGRYRCFAENSPARLG
jgi:hypothetical protein